MSQSSHLEELLALHLRCKSIEHVREFRFAREAVGNPKKNIRETLKANQLKDWRFDFAILPERIAIEVEGGIFVGGRHNRPVSFREDCLKYNSATVLGWAVLRFTDQEIKSGDALLMIWKMLKARRRRMAA